MVVFRNMITREGWGYVRWTDVPLYTRWTGSCQAADVANTPEKASEDLYPSPRIGLAPTIGHCSLKEGEQALLRSNIMTRAFTCSAMGEGEGRVGNGGGIPLPLPSTGSGQDRSRREALQQQFV